MNTRKLTLLFVLLVIIYVCFQLVIRSLNHGHFVDYVLKDKDQVEKFTIEETRTTRVRNERDNYYFEIQSSKMKYNIQMFQNFKKLNYVIKNIKAYRGSTYECIYPIFKQPEIKSDIICQKNGIQIEYANLNHHSKGLNSFEQSLRKWGYKKSDYVKYSKKSTEYKEVSYYPKNLLENHTIVLDNYKGIYILNKEGIQEISLFDNDQYEKTLRSIVDKYYIIADYNEKFSFHQFFLINLENNKKTKISFTEPISFDSYIQGIYKDSLYLIDKDNKKQYEINVKKKTVKEIGNEEKGIKILKNGDFKIDKIQKYINRKAIFTDDYSKLFGNDYSKIVKKGNKKSGYYYLYKKNNGKYKVYRASVQNPKILTYLFTTHDMDQVYYDEDVIYYRYNNMIYLYRNYNKIPILTDSEFEFNKTLQIGLYKK